VITAIVLIKTDVDRIPEIAESIAALEHVSEVYSVTGTYDLVALVRVARHDDLADVIPGRISKIAGVAGTDTHVAFRTYSQHDLESAFAIGLEG
jgi:DNA-binding Lrp family transcriptional regulator